MAKFTQKIIFLTKKNLKIRFSRKCLTFCELFIPLLLTATIGILTSNESRRSRYNSSPVQLLYPDSSENETKEDGPDARFACLATDDDDDDSIWSYYQYNCELRYDFINKENTMEKVKTLNISYLAADKVDKNLLDEVMTSILKAAPKPQFRSDKSDNSTTNWIRSVISEKQLEVCIMQLHEKCKSIEAAVIFTNIQDEVEHGNKFTVNYKIRLADDHESDVEYFTNRLFADYNFDSFRHFMAGIHRVYMNSASSRHQGIISIQTFIDRGIMEYISAKHGNGKAKMVQLSLVRMPYVQPLRNEDITKFISLLYSLLTSLTIFSLMQVNSEKCSGFKELLRMHGITTWTQWMGWLFSSFLVYSIWTLLLTLLFCLPLAGGPNILTLGGINCFIYWLLLLLFVMAITSFCFLISVFFERVWTAASIGLVSWIMLTVFMMIASSTFQSLRTWTAIGLMLVPTVAFDFTFRLFLSGGGTFQTMGIPVIEDVSLTCLHCLFMLLLDSCIYMTLAMYLDNVLPSKYGVKKPPFYFIRDLRKFLRKITARDAGTSYENKCDDDESVEMTSIISQDSQQPFESDPEHMEATVVIRNLRKVFKRNKKRAVDGLNAKMFTGEIYTLLGFNGAGKTTTIGLLTGLTAPTEGVARIFDLDITKDMEEIRRHIGLCPQHNLLFNEMSVLELVAFFGSLKGLSDPYVRATELLKWLGMYEKLQSKPEQLSGGQKRRVHLAIALIGDTKLAFLDEPTSGLDPETRRGVWDILLKLRGKMTVILTTHDMEEADVLGDRIGIMSEGKMICSGTPSYLKKYYGVGYNLKMSTTGSNCDHENVSSFCRQYVPNAKLNNVGPSSSDGPYGSISISLPTANLDLSQIADLMDALRDQQNELCVENIGLSLSTMDEVFLKVGEAVHAVTVTVPETSGGNISTNNLSTSRFVDYRLTWYRYNTLLLKRMLYFCSAPFTLIFLMLFFSTVLWVSLTTLSQVVISSTEEDPPRVISSSALSSYHFPVVLLHERNNASILASKQNDKSISYTTAYQLQLHRNSEKYDPIIIDEFPRNTTFREMMTSLKNESLQDLHYYRQHYLVGASFDNSIDPPNATGFFSAYALHSAPLSLNLITQTLIKKMTGVDATIGVVNHPFKKAATYRHITPENVRYNGKLYYFVTCGEAILLVVITSLLTGTAALLPTEERLNKGKQLQLMTGTTPFLYWTSMFTWDFMFFSLINAIITLIFILTDYLTGKWVYTNNGAGLIIYIILECHSFAALWFCYLVSWAPCIKTASDSFIIVNKLALIIGVLWNVVRQLLVGMIIGDIVYRYSETNLITKIIYYTSYLSGYVAWIVPMFSLFQSIMKLTFKSIGNSICNWFPEEVLHLACEMTGIDTEKENLFIHSCCPGCKEDCFKPNSYFNLSSRSVAPTMFYENDSHVVGHSMVVDIVLMILSGILCAGILFALEYLLPDSRAKRQIAKLSSASPEGASILATTNVLDEDVVNEAARVEDIVKDNALETANHALVTHNLHLKFGELKAVNGLSFGVHRGECFGLLGVNGAGKTSAFRMLTGDIFPSVGNMYSGGLNFYKHRSAYLSSIGYCPQFDGIIGSLTGLQMVKLYGALRGIPPVKLQEDATNWLDKFGLLGSASKKCGNYSGGMKRRLSAAMALIGNPKLLLLDEPTTGVDPAFRRQFWNVIREIRESGQSVVLTSHTMDECEALCSRLGIMVDGQFKCLGNIQHLKSRFGKGYILTIKLQRVAEEDEAELDKRVRLLIENIAKKFSKRRIQTKQKTMIQYQVKDKSLWYSDIFRSMEQIRNLPELSQLIEEYSVTETSLEDVFISFASQKNFGIPCTCPV